MTTPAADQTPSDSDQTTSTFAAFIVSFAPAGDEGGVGGYHWFPIRDEAETMYARMEAESRIYQDCVVRLVQVDLPQGLDENEMLVHIYAEVLDGVEDHLPALKQFIPVGAVYTPSGGLSQEEN